MSRSCEAITVVISLIGVVAHLQGELVDTCVQGVHSLSALQLPANDDWDMLHATVRYRTRVHLLVDAGRQNRESVERIITDLRRRAGLHSSLATSARASPHSSTYHLYETCFTIDLVRSFQAQSRLWCCVPL